MFRKQRRVLLWLRFSKRPALADSRRGHKVAAAKTLTTCADRGKGVQRGKRRIKELRMAPTRYANTRAADTDWVVSLRSTYSPLSSSRAPHLRRLDEHTNTTNFIDRKPPNDPNDQ